MKKYLTALFATVGLGIAAAWAAASYPSPTFNNVFLQGGLFMPFNTSIYWANSGGTNLPLIRLGSGNNMDFTTGAGGSFSMLGNVISGGGSSALGIPTVPWTNVVSNQLELAKLGSTPSTAGAGLGILFMTAGTNAGSCKLQMIAGTSATPVTIVDNVGSGC